ncbi:hypothetical protein BH20ACT19_BH20ACT19_01110 [soil metagenome]
MLIVGCGCRGRELATALVADGRAVRGTSRSEVGRAAIEEAGFEGVVADPDRPGTVLTAVEGVSLAVWLMGSATGSAAQLAALHGPRLETLLERLVDTHVRGFVYEAHGSVDPRLLDGGAAAVRSAAATWSIPVQVAGADPGDRKAWLATMRAAVAEALA